MSFMNINLEISYLSINLKICKNHEKEKETIRKKVEQDRRIKDILEKRSNIEQHYNLYNMMR